MILYTSIYRLYRAVSMDTSTQPHIVLIAALVDFILGKLDTNPNAGKVSKTREEINRLEIDNAYLRLIDACKKAVTDIEEYKRGMNREYRALHERLSLPPRDLNSGELDRALRSVTEATSSDPQLDPARGITRTKLQVVKVQNSLLKAANEKRAFEEMASNAISKLCSKHVSGRLIGALRAHGR